MTDDWTMNLVLARRFNTRTGAKTALDAVGAKAWGSEVLTKRLAQAGDDHHIVEIETERMDGTAGRLFLAKTT